MRDFQISDNFRLSEFPGWESATLRERTRAQRLAWEILQPLRDAVGPVEITSWLRRDSRDSRSMHSNGSAVDFVCDDNAQAWEWLATHRRQYFGELILEPDHRLQGGGGAHVHVTLYGYGGRGEVLRETQEGQYVAGRIPYVWPVLALVALWGAIEWLWWR